MESIVLVQSRVGNASQIIIIIVVESNVYNLLLHISHRQVYGVAARNIQQRHAAIIRKLWTMGYIFQSKSMTLYIQILYSK